MVTLQQVLQAKEDRLYKRQAFQAQHPHTTISLSLNIPGAQKDSPAIRLLFGKAVTCLQSSLTILACQTTYCQTGPHGLFAVAEQPVHSKAITCQLEKSSGYARLWDFDVYQPDGQAVADSNRQHGRPCLLCDQPAIACMRAAQHSQTELQAKVNSLFVELAAEQSNAISPLAQHYGALALEATLYEIACCPSPGLVDPLHNGAHKDMDFFTFQSSSAALAHTFNRCLQAGLQHSGSPQELLPVLRQIGQQGEAKMFAATAGINTHKGLLFSLGLTLGATGIALQTQQAPKAQTISRLLQQITADLIASELATLGDQARTAGEKSYQRFALTGIRGEVAAGLPSVINFALPTLKQSLLQGLDLNKSLLKTLLTLITVVDDTTILNRSPQIETLNWLKTQAYDFLQTNCLEQTDWQEKLWQLDERFIARNLSPGGSADLLAITWYLYKSETHSADTPADQATDKGDLQN